MNQNWGYSEMKELNKIFRQKRDKYKKSQKQLSQLFEQYQNELQKSLSKELNKRLIIDYYSSTQNVLYLLICGEEKDDSYQDISLIAKWRKDNDISFVLFPIYYSKEDFDRIILSNRNAKSVL